MAQALPLRQLVIETDALVFARWRLWSSSDSCFYAASLGRVVGAAQAELRYKR